MGNTDEQPLGLGHTMFKLIKSTGSGFWVKERMILITDTIDTPKVGMVYVKRFSHD
jgi:hypothetical protein